MDASGFSDEAFAAIQFAVEEAGDGVVHTGYILLGCLLQSESLAARALQTLNVTEERVRQYNDVFRETGKVNEFSQSAKKAIYTASATTTDREPSREIQPEDLVAAILAEPTSGLVQHFALDLESFLLHVEILRDFKSAGTYVSKIAAVRPYPGPREYENICRLVQKELHAFCAALVNDTQVYVEAEGQDLQEAFYQVLTLGGRLGRRLTEQVGPIFDEPVRGAAPSSLLQWSRTVSVDLLAVKDGPEETQELTRLVCELDSAVVRLGMLKLN
ncbi:MAG TPA: hypothetical protein EYO33_32795 [Phycisphaerales bacterium]|nr:hypothetical protein [Phycisphaerales bacterium]